MRQPAHGRRHQGLARSPGLHAQQALLLRAAHTAASCPLSRSALACRRHPGLGFEIETCLRKGFKTACVV